MSPRYVFYTVHFVTQILTVHGTRVAHGSIVSDPIHSYPIHGWIQAMPYCARDEHIVWDWRSAESRQQQVEIVYLQNVEANSAGASFLRVVRPKVGQYI